MPIIPERKHPQHPQHPKWSLIPSQDVIKKFTGLHCSSLYASLDAQWRCPCCNRLKTELIRWSYIGGKTWQHEFGDIFGYGFTISLARHHCHSANFDNDFSKPRSGRFSEIVICGDCNSADGAAKRKLILPKTWSFSAKEIGQFVKAEPYSGKTDINYEKAKSIYDSCQYLDQLIINA